MLSQHALQVVSQHALQQAPGGGSAPGGVPAPGGYLLQGGVCGDPPLKEDGSVVDGTHPTGMHSSLLCIRVVN